MDGSIVSEFISSINRSNVFVLLDLHVCMYVSVCMIRTF